MFAALSQCCGWEWQAASRCSGAWSWSSPSSVRSPQVGVWLTCPSCLCCVLDSVHGRFVDDTFPRSRRSPECPDLSYLIPLKKPFRSLSFGDKYLGHDGVTWGPPKRCPNGKKRVCRRFGGERPGRGKGGRVGAQAWAGHWTGGRGWGRPSPDCNVGRECFGQAGRECSVLSQETQPGSSHPARLPPFYHQPLCWRNRHGLHPDSACTDVQES